MALLKILLLGEVARSWDWESEGGESRIRFEVGLDYLPTAKFIFHWPIPSLGHALVIDPVEEYSIA